MKIHKKTRKLSCVGRVLMKFDDSRSGKRDTYVFLFSDFWGPRALKTLNITKHREPKIYESICINPPYQSQRISLRWGGGRAVVIG